MRRIVLSGGLIPFFLLSLTLRDVALAASRDGEGVHASSLGWGVEGGEPRDILFPASRAPTIRAMRGMDGSINPNPGDTLRWDDGSVWTRTHYFSGGNGWGVQFLPYYHPCRVTSLIQWFSSGWPNPGGDDLILWILDDDGPGGSPGTILSVDTLYNAITFDAWNEFAVGDTGVVFQDGGFYGVYIQLEDGPNCPAVSFDDGYSESHSWDYYNGEWRSTTVYGDMLLRAYIERAGGDAHDVGVLEILSPARDFEPGVPIIPTAVVKNFGTFTDTFFMVCQIEKDGSLVYDQSFTVTGLGPGERSEVSFPEWTGEMGNVYLVRFTTKLASDVSPENDAKSLLTRNYTVSRDQVLVEGATGTWCYYCQFSAEGLDSLRTVLGDSVAIVEYHNNDPFSNAFSDARIAYYNIHAYPTVVFGGVERSVGGGSGMYSSYRIQVDQELQKKIPVDIHLEGNYNEQTRMAFVQVDLNAVDGIAATDLRLYVVLTESHIAYDWFDQDSLQFVVREIFPHAAGVPISLAKGDSHQELLDFPVSTGYVDTHCEVVVFLQDYPTREVLASISAPLTQLTVSIGDHGEGMGLPGSFALSPNYPNPFNPRTTIAYEIPEGAPREIELMIYDIRGRLVKVLDSGEKSPGVHRVTWDGRDETGQRLGSGVFFYRLVVGGWERTEKMLLVK